VEHPDQVIDQTIDPAGRQVVLLARIWVEKILCIHPEMEAFRADALQAIADPECVESDPIFHRMRYFSRNVGPTTWLMVVVSYEQQPARIISAYGYRKDPPLWKQSA
jgi:hypothetical protein